MAAIETLVGGLLTGVTGNTVAAILYEAVAQFVKLKLGRNAVVAPITDLAALSLQIQQAEQRTSDADQISLTAEMLSKAHTSASQVRDERLRQASITFNVAVILAIGGTLLVLAGLAFIFFSSNKVLGGVGALGGAVSNILSAVVFRLNRETNDRLDNASGQVAMIEAAQIAADVASRMAAGESRDDTFREIALRIVQASPTRRRRST